MNRCKSSSADPSKFIVAKNSLSSGLIYNMSVVAYDSINGRQSTVSTVMVEVEYMPLQAVVVPIGRQVLRLGESLKLDASGSYDPNIADSVANTSSFVFTWSCQVINATNPKGCLLSFQLPIASTNTTVTVFASDMAAVGNTYIVQLSVMSTVTSAKAVKSIEVSVVEPNAPRISFSSSETQYSNVDVKKMISMNAEVQSSVACEAIWSVGPLTLTNTNTTTLDLSTMSLLPLKKVVSGSSSVSFLLSPNTLSFGMKYLFKLQCGSSSNHMLVTTNSPPTGGSFSVIPNTGVELSTIFYFTGRDWVDSDLPLSFEFGFISTKTSNLLLIREKMELHVAQSQLPAGLMSRGYVVDTRMQVYDAFGCSSQQSLSVMVRGMEANTLSASLFASINQLLSVNSTLSTEQIKRTVVLAGTALNKVNCTRAPDCESTLHRESCGVRDHTCGNCLASFYGEKGPSNQPCVTKEELVQSSASSSSRPIQTTCSSLCQEHGNCQFFDKSTVQKVTRCPLYGVTCEAFCVCEDGYAGVDCNQQKELLEQNQLIRKSLLQAIESLPITGEDEGTDALVYAALNRVSMMRNVLFDSEDAIDSSSTTTSLVAEMTQALLSSMTSASSSFGADDISDTAVVADFLLNVMMRQATCDVVKQQEDSNNAKSIVDVLISLGDVLISSSPIGISSSLMFERFRLISTSNTDENAMNLTVPLTDLENIVGVESAVFSVIDKTESSTAVQIIQTPSFLWDTYDSSNITAKIALSYAFTLRISSSILRFQMKLPIVSNDLSNPIDPIGFRSNCSVGMGTLFTFLCPDSNVTLTHRCTGEADGQLISYCPVLQPSCQLMPMKNDISKQETICNMTSFNTEKGYMVCDCLLLSETNRQLDNSNSNSDSTIVLSNVMTLLGITEYVGRDVASTFIASQSLNHVESADQVMIVLSLFVAVWSIGSILICYIYWNKNYHANSHKKKTEKKKHKKVGHWHGLKAVFGNKTRTVKDECEDEEEDSDDEEEIDNATDRRRAILNKTLQKVHHNNNNNNNRIHNQDEEVPHSLPINPELVVQLLSNYLSTVIPRAFSSQSILLRMKEETMRHHPYLRLFNLQESDRSPILATLHMLTIQCLMMFVLAMLYDLQGPDDDGTCSKYMDETNCLKRRSLFDHDQSYCHWNMITDANGRCEYVDPVFSWTVVVYCAVLISLVTALINWPIDYMFTVLSAPIVNTTRAQIVATQMNARARRASVAGLPPTAPGSTMGRRAAVSSISLPGVPVAASSTSATNSAVAANAVMPASFVLTSNNKKGNHLSKSGVGGGMLHRVRSNKLEVKFIPEHLKQAHDVAESAIRLSGVGAADQKANPQQQQQQLQQQQEDLALFDTVSVYFKEKIEHYQSNEFHSHSPLFKRFTEQWGISPITGRVYDLVPPRNVNSHCSSVLDLIHSSLVTIEETVKEEILYLQQVPTESQRGLELIQLFVQDLLGQDTVAARIYAAKVNEDYRTFPAVTHKGKIASTIVLVLLNFLFAYYTMLKGYVKGKQWQRSFVFACLVQFMIEILLFATMECLYFHCFVPSLVSQEMQKVQQIIRETIQFIAFDNNNANNHENQKEHWKMKEGKKGVLSSLNAPDYFFVSTKVAKVFPTMFESFLIQSYRTVLPGEMSEKWRGVYHWSKNEEMKKKEFHPSSDSGIGIESSRSSLHTNSTDSMGASSSTISPSIDDKKQSDDIRSSHLPWLETIESVGFTIMISVTVMIAYIVATIPFDLQRAMIRFAQPFILGGLIFAWYKIISNTIYLSLFIVFLILVVTSLITQHLLRQRLLRRNKIQCNGGDNSYQQS